MVFSVWRHARDIRPVYEQLTYSNVSDKVLNCDFYSFDYVFIVNHIYEKCYLLINIFNSTVNVLNCFVKVKRAITGN